MTETIRKLLVEEMQDMYGVERRLLRTLPKMVNAATNQELSAAFENHLQQTRGHVERLERAFQMLEQKPKGRPCAAMVGLIGEAQERIDATAEGSLADSAMICAAQKVEHYEIAGYRTLKAWAEELGLDDVAALLQETLDEEKDGDQKLSEIAGKVLAEAEMTKTDNTVNATRSSR